MNSTEIFNAWYKSKMSWANDMYGHGFDEGFINKRLEEDFWMFAENLWGERWVDQLRTIMRPNEGNQGL